MYKQPTEDEKYYAKHKKGVADSSKNNKCNKDRKRTNLIHLTDKKNKSNLSIKIELHNLFKKDRHSNTNKK